MEDVRRLFRQYEEWISSEFGADLTFQDFASEVANLPGIYAPPGGELLLARDNMGKAIGCFGTRPLEAKVRYEIKRPYVLPGARVSGAGRRTVVRMIEIVGERGYREMVRSTDANRYRAPIDPR